MLDTMQDRWTTGGMSKYWTRNHGWGRENGENHKWDERMTSRDVPVWPGSDWPKIETPGKILERLTSEKVWEEEEEIRL